MFYNLFHQKIIVNLLSFNFMKKLLLPISLLYSLILLIRHKFYDWGLLKSRSFDIPNICVGNLNLGGTGKTPHSEYLIRLLSDKYKVAVLSRGYGRKTNGFILANDRRTPIMLEFIKSSTLSPLYRWYARKLLAIPFSCAKNYVNNMLIWGKGTWFFEIL